jgi:hypothetical protein
MRQILHVFGAPVPGAPRGCVSVVRAAGACDPLDPVIPLSRHQGSARAMTAAAFTTIHCILLWISAVCRKPDRPTRRVSTCRDSLSEHWHAPCTLALVALTQPNQQSRLNADSQSSNQSPTLRLPFICEAGQKLTCQLCRRARKHACFALFCHSVVGCWNSRNAHSAAQNSSHLHLLLHGATCVEAATATASESHITAVA